MRKIGNIVEYLLYKNSIYIYFVKFKFKIIYWILILLKFNLVGVGEIKI